MRASLTELRSASSSPTPVSLRPRLFAAAEEARIASSEAAASSRRHETLSTQLDSMASKAACDGSTRTSDPSLSVLARAAITSGSLAQCEAELVALHTTAARAMEAVAALLEPALAADVVSSAALAEDAMDRVEEAQQRAAMWAARLREQRLQLVAMVPGGTPAFAATPTRPTTRSVQPAQQRVKAVRHSAPLLLLSSSSSSTVVVAVEAEKKAAEDEVKTETETEEEEEEEEPFSEDDADEGQYGRGSSSSSKRASPNREQFTRRMSLSMTKMHSALTESHAERIAMMQQLREVDLPKAWRMQLELRVALKEVQSQCEERLHEAQVEWLQRLVDVRERYAAAQSHDRTEILRLTAVVELLQKREAAWAGDADVAAAAAEEGEEVGEAAEAVAAAERDAAAAIGAKKERVIESEAAEVLFALDQRLERHRTRPILTSVIDPVTGDDVRASEVGWNGIDVLFMQRCLMREDALAKTSERGAAEAIATVLAGAYKIVDGARAARTTAKLAEQRARQRALMQRTLMRIQNSQYSAAWKAWRTVTDAIGKVRAQEVLLQRFATRWGGRLEVMLFAQWAKVTAAARTHRAVLWRGVAHLVRARTVAAWGALREHGCLSASEQLAAARRMKVQHAAAEAMSVAWRAASAATDSAATASMVLAIQALALARARPAPKAEIAAATAAALTRLHPLPGLRASGAKATPTVSRVGVDEVHVAWSMSAHASINAHTVAACEVELDPTPPHGRQHPPFQPCNACLMTCLQHDAEYRARVRTRDEDGVCGPWSAWSVRGAWDVTIA